MVEMIPQMIAVLAPDGQALYVNELTLEYTGLVAHEARGTDFRRRVFHPEDVERLKERRIALELVGDETGRLAALSFQEREADRRLANRLRLQGATAADNVGCGPPQSPSS